MSKVPDLAIGVIKALQDGSSYLTYYNLTRDNEG